MSFFATSVRGAFRDWIRPEYCVSDEPARAAVRETARARVRCVVEFAGRARQLGGLRGLLPPAAVYRFDLNVANEDGVWRVQEASWEMVQPDAG